VIFLAASRAIRYKLPSISILSYLFKTSFVHLPTFTVGRLSTAIPGRCQYNAYQNLHSFSLFLRLCPHRPTLNLLLFLISVCGDTNRGRIAELTPLTHHHFQIFKSAHFQINSQIDLSAHLPLCSTSFSPTRPCNPLALL
jgi:hypothetical protein